MRTLEFRKKTFPDTSRPDGLIRDREDFDIIVK